MTEHDETLDRRLPADSVGGADERAGVGLERRLGDFTFGPHALRLVALALVVGALSAGIALALLDLIGLFTHLAYYGTVGWTLVPPTLHRFGAWTVAIPVVGGLLVGLMARFGSERIRGHGIPEAMETILIGGSKVEPRLTVLKPVSSAISIGSGGPFGAEGPIILTGGAVGSVFAQLLHLTASERRALLVAGACGGMAAVFGTPVAAVLFGVELLVFEWKPRSFVPIAAAVSVAATLREVFVRHALVSRAPLFPVAAHLSLAPEVVAKAAAIGLVAGVLAWLLTAAVYGAEDAFKHLPIHWAWWPALGGLVVGVGGLIDPRALGVGYATIADELAGRLALGALALLLVVKLVIWATALGSGTSGGILAPLLMMGAAAGGMLGHAFGGSAGAWAVLGMGATLAGVTRSPFTSIVFAVELTHEQTLLLPLLVACTAAHLVSVLALRRSILTEKVARRGFHVMREYAVDPLEAMFVREVMQAGGNGFEPAPGPVAFPDEVLRTVAGRMAAEHVDTLPVVDRADPGLVLGSVTVFDLLAARRRQLMEERHRERPLPLLPLLRRSVLSRR
ncbi:MAG TPA: chloride channel protein [Gaiellaceae bacterium]|nr:chloride channel protein [Gaiellaceae bacterium]